MIDAQRQMAFKIEFIHEIDILRYVDRMCYVDMCVCVCGSVAFMFALKMD